MTTIPKAHRAHFQVGDTMHLFYGGSQESAQRGADEAAARFMAEGAAIQHDGWREYIAVRADQTDGDYVWHQDGNRVRVTRCHVRVDGTGDERVVTETRLRSSYRDYLSVID